MRAIREALAGVLAAALALGATELAAGILPGGTSPFVAVGDAAIALTPGAVVRFAIETFGSQNRLVLLTSMTVVAAIAGALVGLGAARDRRVAVAGIGGFGLIGMVAGIGDPLMPLLTAVLAPTVGAVAGVAALGALLRAAGSREPVDARHRVPEIVAAGSGTGTGTGQTTGSGGGQPAGSGGGPADDRPAAPGTAGGSAVTASGSRPTRRSFLAVAATTAVTAVAFGATGRTLQARALVEGERLATRLPGSSGASVVTAPGTSLEVPGITPLITPNDDFYRIDTAFTVPQVDPTTHAVRVTGMVDEPFEVTYDDLVELADTEAFVTLSCVSNEVGGDLVGNALWLGVPLDRLLERAGVQPGATQIVGRSVDGWTGGFPVEAAFDGRPALVAVGMNGEPLPARHGFPVRLVISGLYGYVSDTKWLAEIELTTFEAFDAYWVPRGWSARGPIKTQSRIDVPGTGTVLDVGPAVVAGVAWSDERGLSAVQVRVDDGPWREAELADELASTAWRQWRLSWDATPGDHALRVRAVDADGQPQIADEAPPAPDGATGHHTVNVRVT